MSADRDLSALLPEAPPPRPARRDAAIEEALRRFDGQPPERPAKKVPSTRGPLWRRPEVGVLVAASLVAVLALPVWLVSDRQGVRPHAEGITSIDVPAPTAAPRDAAPQAAEQAAKREAAPETPPPAALAEEPAAPAQPKAEQRRAEAEAGQAFQVAGPEQLAPPPPPPPPPPIMAAPAAPPAAEANAVGSADIVTTARRREDFADREAAAPRKARAAGALAAPGAASAGPVFCTIDDPRRDLRACRDEIKAAAPGASGRAAAHVAEGLSRAWQGDLDRAIAEFDRAIAISPDLASAWRNRGLAWRRKGDLTRAQADLDRAAMLERGSR